MTIQASTPAPVSYAALESEWLSLASPEAKAAFWARMRLLFAGLDAEQVERFFEHLQKSAADVALRLELATQRAELAGFRKSAS